MQKCLKLNAKGNILESKQVRVIHVVYSVSIHVGLHSFNVLSKYLE